MKWKSGEKKDDQGLVCVSFNFFPPIFSKNHSGGLFCKIYTPDSFYIILTYLSLFKLSNFLCFCLSQKSNYETDRQYLLIKV